MNQVELHLTVCEWGSKHSNRTFNSWQQIALPKPAKDYVPDWHKATPSTVDGDRTIKRCMPVTDALTAGYILPAPVDIRVCRTSDDELSFDDSDGEFFVTRHAPKQYKETHFKDSPVIKIDFPWLFKTPPGWSMLYTQPFNRDNTKLEALTAVVETDNYYNGVNCPIVVKDWEVGEILTIPKGYPLVQAVPVMREEWKLKISSVDWSEHLRTTMALSANSSAYRDKFREKKRFS
jgi:hypothetical protein